MLLPDSDSATNLKPGANPEVDAPVDLDTGNTVQGYIDSTPSSFDPAASHDGGHTTVPSGSPSEGFEDDTPLTNPHTAAAADVLGSGGTAA